MKTPKKYGEVPEHPTHHIAIQPPIPYPTICRNCAHWKGDRNANSDYPINAPDDEWRVGVCGRLNRTLEITVHAGWNGGTVNDIYTPISFGCVLFKLVG